MRKAENRWMLRRFLKGFSKALCPELSAVKIQTAEYFGNGKPIYFFAVGGNAEKGSEVVSLTGNVVANKCTWLSLLIQVTKLRDEHIGLSMRGNGQSSLIRLLNLIELAFNIHGVYNIQWFEDIKISKPLISPDSIQTFKTYFE